MAALDDYIDDDGWETVVKGMPAKACPIDTLPKGKAARRNARKREERVRAAADEAHSAEMSISRLAIDELTSPGLQRALAASLSVDSDEAAATESVDASRQRRLKALAKRLKAIEALEAKDGCNRDDAQREKIEKRPDLESEIESIEAEVVAAKEEQQNAAVKSGVGDGGDFSDDLFFELIRFGFEV